MIYKIYKKDIGARASQQDNVNILEDKGNILMVLGDGMGGHTGGAVASSILIDVSNQVFCGVNYNKPEEFFNNIISTAYNKIKFYAEDRGEDPHTTASFALIKEDALHYGYIGDSRIYIFDENGFVTRTRDDSVPEMLFQMGEIEEDEIDTHHEQNKLTKSLGSYKLNTVFYKKFDFEKEKSYMVIVCSDGFWTQISMDEMFNLFDLDDKERDIELEELVLLSKERAGESADNISIALAKIDRDGQRENSSLLEKILIFFKMGKRRGK